MSIYDAGTLADTQLEQTVYSPGDIVSYPYQGSVRPFFLNNAKKIKIECWGACGYRSDYSRQWGSKSGGYVSGNLSLESIKSLGKDKLFCVVGQGGNNDSSRAFPGTFGGGGAGARNTRNDFEGRRADADKLVDMAGGGATDVRLEYSINNNSYKDIDNQPYNEWRSVWHEYDKGTLAPESLKSRIIVAGGSGADDSKSGGGGSGECTDKGGYINASGATSLGDPDICTGGQSFTLQLFEDYQNDYYYIDGQRYQSHGTFGIGASDNNENAGSGGGYYGGTSNNQGHSGSSYIQGHPNCINTKKNNYTFSFTDMTVTPGGAAEVNTANSGNGQIKITILEVEPVQSSKKLCARYDDTTEYSNLYSENNLSLMTTKSYIHKVLVEGTNLWGLAIKSSEENHVISLQNYPVGGQYYHPKMGNGPSAVGPNDNYYFCVFAVPIPSETSSPSANLTDIVHISATFTVAPYNSHSQQAEIVLLSGNVFDGIQKGIEISNDHVRDAGSAKNDTLNRLSSCTRLLGNSTYCTPANGYTFTGINQYISFTETDKAYTIKIDINQLRSSLPNQIVFGGVVKQRGSYGVSTIGCDIDPFTIYMTKVETLPAITKMTYVHDNEKYYFLKDTSIEAPLEEHKYSEEVPVRAVGGGNWEDSPYDENKGIVYIFSDIRINLEEHLEAADISASLVFNTNMTLNWIGNGSNKRTVADPSDERNAMTFCLTKHPDDCSSWLNIPTKHKYIYGCGNQSDHPWIDFEPRSKVPQKFYQIYDGNYNGGITYGNTISALDKPVTMNGYQQISGTQEVVLNIDVKNIPRADFSQHLLLVCVIGCWYEGSSGGICEPTAVANQKITVSGTYIV